MSVEEFRAALERNSALVHGPLSPADAAVRAVDRATALAAGRPVAVTEADHLMDVLNVAELLAETGVSVVTSTTSGWRQAIAHAAVGVTGARAGVSETGTLALGCGPGAPRSVSLLPDAHVCLVEAGTITERMEDALPIAIADGLPPNLVWISGPSRSADIEKRITLGVHGPRTVEVVIVDGSSD